MESAGGSILNSYNYEYHVIYNLLHGNSWSFRTLLGSLYLQFCELGLGYSLLCRPCIVCLF